MAEQIVVYGGDGIVMEYYCEERNNEWEKFYVDWVKLKELMQSERSKTRRTMYTEADILW